MNEKEFSEKCFYYSLVWAIAASAALVVMLVGVYFRNRQTLGGTTLNVYNDVVYWFIPMVIVAFLLTALVFWTLGYIFRRKAGIFKYTEETSNHSEHSTVN